MHARKRYLIQLVGVMALGGAARAADPQPRFPVARAQEEFVGLLHFVRGWGQSNRGDSELFRRWTLPYGPMDLQVAKANHDEASALRNLYLGFAGGVFGVDAAKMANSFHCGQTCIDSRRQDLESKVVRIEKLVGAFRKLKGVDILAQWGIPNEFRVNCLFKIFDQVRVSSPSPVMGFLPSSQWDHADPDSYITSLGASPSAVRAILSELTALSVAAIVRESDGSVRVIRVGISDNESGLHFLLGQKVPYRVGTKLTDGREITVLREIKSGILFYETT